MTTMTIAPAASAFDRDPFYAMGKADAYDEYMAGESIHTLRRRAHEMLDADTRGQMPADLYRLGYGNAIAGLMNGHIATVNAQAEVAHRSHSKKAHR
jgi:hypothetical protein